ncbi:hypothetical protein B9Z55_014079 [Caenorhabditis nigoni]|uniref:Uncharacterized protein n=1 Tax=Caenorhabditis nigoni TaxID=1611254 RepID=A0A2G5U4I1_9PELO|nr:hypothetical protein B9Z55_014079 [Caenorhabditis nigoni]
MEMPRRTVDKLRLIGRRKRIHEDLMENSAGDDVEVEEEEEEEEIEELDSNEFDNSRIHEEYDDWEDVVHEGYEAESTEESVRRFQLPNQGRNVFLLDENEVTNEKCSLEEYGKKSTDIRLMAQSDDNFVWLLTSFTGSILPAPQPVMDPHYLYIMNHGYGIISQLALVAAQKKKPVQDIESMSLDQLTGAWCNVPKEEKFFYPDEAPFNGKEIELRTEMPRFHGLTPHVLIKKMIFTILSRSCEIPEDIQTITWFLPNDSGTPRTLNPSLFPQSLYNTIERILLLYFELEEDLLSRGTYDQEACKDMRCLSGLTDQMSRRKRYMGLHQAKCSFQNATYHFQFKAAIADLRRSTYIPPQPGHKFGHFKLNPVSISIQELIQKDLIHFQRSKRSRNDEADELDG